MVLQDEEMNEQQPVEKLHKPSKKGIIYLSTIPPYMNVAKIREIFTEYGKVGRIYLELTEKRTKQGGKKLNKRKIAHRYKEGWVEFDKKCVAKRVAAHLNNTQVSSRKKSKNYDSIWNIKYLSNFKWTHLHERLAYEKAVRNKKLKAEIQLAKRNVNFFMSNLDKKNKQVTNKEFENIDEFAAKPEEEEEEENNREETRSEFLQKLFNSQ